MSHKITITEGTVKTEGIILSEEDMRIINGNANFLEQHIIDIEQIRKTQKYLIWTVAGIAFLFAICFLVLLVS